MLRGQKKGVTMAEDKKTRLELEEQKKIADEVREAFDENSMKLRKSYSADAQKLLKEMDNYYGDVKESTIGKRLETFLENEKNIPSEFFRKELKHLPGWVPDHLLEDFYTSIDSIIKWQTSQYYYRRTMRTKRYGAFLDRYFRIMNEYHSMGIYGCDIVSLYKEKLPQDILCYYRDGSSNGYRIISEYWIQAELDRGNEEFEEVLMDIMFGESAQARLTTNILRGIYMSSNTRLHEAVGKLLVAAKLQEGLRQAICENMDYGTADAFMTLFHVIKENDLLRFSSVMRAVATWTGLVTDEESKLDRIQKKQLLLIDTYLNDENARREALSGEDAMQIYLALWSYGFFDVDEACHVMNKLALDGSRHQRLVFGTYIRAMSLGKVYTHSVAKEFIKRFPDEMDTMAVIMPSFMSDYQPYMNSLIYKDGRSYNNELKKMTFAEVDKYFDNRKECQEMYDILMGILERMPNKRLEFDPCVFPWNAEYLDRSAIIMRLAVCASALRDEDKITHIAEMVPEIDSARYSRDALLLLLVRQPANDRQRAILVDAVADKETYTRNKAAMIVKDMKLSPENYVQLENMLKYKKSDIRETVLSILYKLDGDDMDDLIGRLLADSKEEKRTAGLDLLLQLKNDENRQDLFKKCVGCIDGITAKISTKEEILIKEIKDSGADRAGAAEGYGLYDVDADYEPVFDKSYLAECLELYKKYFPESGIANGDLCKEANNDGAFAKLKSKILPKKKAAESDSKVINILRKLDAFVDEHKNYEYEMADGEIGLLGEMGGIVYWNRDKVACEELWIEFYEKNIQTPYMCMQLHMYLNGYNSDKQDFKKYCESFMLDMFGNIYIEEVPTFGYHAIARSVIGFLYRRYVPDSEKMKLAIVAADYLLGRSDELIYTFGGNKGGSSISGDDAKVYHRSVLTNEQIMIITRWLAIDGDSDILDVKEDSDEARQNEEDFRHLFPYNYALAKCHNFNIPSDVVNDRDSYYWVHTGSVMPVPGLLNYIAAYSRGIISRDYMYKMAFEGNSLDRSLKCVSDVMRFITERNRKVQTRGYEWGYTERERLRSVRQILLHSPEGEFSETDEKMLDIAKKLYTDMSELVLAAELTRGDTETEFSPYIYGLTRIFGAEYFVRILSALGKETLERSTYFNTGYYYNRQNVSKKNSMSHLLQACVPDANDSAETLKAYLTGTDISDARLIEAAMYSPEWIDIVGEYLGWDGFTAGCYYFMAHMNESFDDKRKAMIARFTPLEVDELNDGAFDRTWFTEVYDRLGDKRFQLIYKAAKYISDGAKHTRARKYADAALGKYDEAELMAEIEAKRNKDLLMAVGILPIENEEQIKDRYMFLQKFKKESKQFGAQRRASEAAAVSTAMRNMAINAGYQDVTRLTLRMESLMAQDMAEYFKPHEVGEVTIWLEMEDGGKCAVICEKNGKQLKSVPAKIKKDEYVLALMDVKKQMAEQSRRTKAMLEDAMESQEEYTWAEIRGMLENPVIHDMVAALVFKVAEPDGVKAELDNAADSIMSGANELDDSKNVDSENNSNLGGAQLDNAGGEGTGTPSQKVVLGFVTEDGFNTFVATSIGDECDQQPGGQKSAVGENIQPVDNADIADTVSSSTENNSAEKTGLNLMNLSDDTKLTVAHPFHMYMAGKWHDIQKYVFDNKIVQPFKQVFRELYVKTEEEMNMEHSLRYAGNQIQPKKTLGCLKSRHWVADIEDGLQKVYYKENIVAQIYALADWFSPADIESPTLEWVVFSDRKTGKDMRIKDIPDIIFSEVMRDVDMAVSVAHAGGVDPETSHSTVEMRKAIAEFTMPLFRLTNVTFTKNHAVIEGKRANYTVHLGSGVVHQEAGPMINVLPVHSQRRGRIFLPFVDDDPKTSEVLTKILFFAEDNKIKDPYILSQIEA